LFRTIVPVGIFKRFEKEQKSRFLPSSPMCPNRIDRLYIYVYVLILKSYQRGIDRRTQLEASLANDKKSLPKGILRIIQYIPVDVCRVQFYCS
jgi:hypothetical protein